MINWKIFLILLNASLFSIVAIFPYVLTVQKAIIQTITIPLPLFIVIQLIQSTLIFSVVIWIGLLLSKKIGFTLPVLEAFTSGKRYLPLIKSILPLSLLSGIAAGISIAIADYTFKLLGVSLTIDENFAPVWQKFLASFYGGISEEILMRLFLMTLFIWISTKIWKSKPNTPTIAAIWISNCLAAICFGIGHLPLTATLTALTPLVIARGIILNGIGGLIFGWLYWKKGLESAIIAHFVTDIMILIVLPYIL